MLPLNLEMVLSSLIGKWLDFRGLADVHRKSGISHVGRTDTLLPDNN